jgi:acid phosphatase type 7
VGAWHLIALNSNCWAVGGCEAGSPQEQWLRADLAAHSNRCTLAYWHHPRFSAGTYADNSSFEPFWQALQDHGAEVVLNAHDHNYQRYAPRTPAGVADPNGVREFVVGTGGKVHYTVDAGPVSNREAANGDTYGVLKLTLHAARYDWRFEPEAGSSFTDSGSASCH